MIKRGDVIAGESQCAHCPRAGDPSEASPVHELARWESERSRRGDQFVQKGLYFVDEMANDRIGNERKMPTGPRD
jgi:hypothetical protein